MYEFFSFLIEKGSNFLYFSGMALLYYLYRRIHHYDKTSAAGHIAWSYPSSLLQQLHLQWSEFCRRRSFFFFFFFFYYFFFFFHWHYSPLWALACRTISFHFFLSVTNSLHLLTPSTWRSLSISIFSWVFPLFSSLAVLEWRSFWASYPPPFPLDDLTSLSFALLSILLYFLLCSSLLVLDSSDFSIPRFYI